jgi:hypothetical protein
MEEIGSYDGNEGYLRTLPRLVGIGVAGWGCYGGDPIEAENDDGVQVLGEMKMNG